MNQARKVIKTKVVSLELGKHLGNAWEACRIMGCSRDSFYRFKELCEIGGEAALQDQRWNGVDEDPRTGGRVSFTIVTSLESERGVRIGWGKGRRGPLGGDSDE